MEHLIAAYNNALSCQGLRSDKHLLIHLDSIHDDPDSIEEAHLHVHLRGPCSLAEGDHGCGLVQSLVQARLRVNPPPASEQTSVEAMHGTHVSRSSESTAEVGWHDVQPVLACHFTPCMGVGASILPPTLASFRSSPLSACAYRKS